MIKKIEVALRCRLVDAILVYKDALIVHDSSIFEDKKYTGVSRTLCKKV